MLERGLIDQSAGLRQLVVQASARVIAMVANGDAATEMPLLWHLCSALESFGYTVTVLDQTTCESDDNPGLQGLLDIPYLPERDSDEVLQWMVLPAAMGLQSLQRRRARHHEPPLQALEPLFGDAGVIVVYANTECLSTLLAGSAVRPLMALSPARRSLVRVYQSLKHLVQWACLHPVVATFASSKAYRPRNVPDQATQNLRECALQHLGYCVDTIAIHASRPGQGRLDDIHKLALNMMDHALPLNPPSATPQAAADEWALSRSLH